MEACAGERGFQSRALAADRCGGTVAFLAPWVLETAFLDSAGGGDGVDCHGICVRPSESSAAAAPAAVVVTVGEADQLERTLDDIQLLNAVDVAPAKPGSSVM